MLFTVSACNVGLAAWVLEDSVLGKLSFFGHSLSGKMGFGSFGIGSVWANVAVLVAVAVVVVVVE